MNPLESIMDVLPGEGDAETVVRVNTRKECENCGEPAHFRHTYLLPNARRNPESSAYRRDDCSWCSDHELFDCRECYIARGSREPRAEGYEWCSTFSNGKFPHMFLYWRELSPLEIKIRDTLHKD